MGGDNVTVNMKL